MTDKEVMQMALDVMLAAIKAGDWKVDGACDPDYVLEALRARLSQCQRCGEVNPAEIHTCTPKEQEPVAWRTFDGEGGYEYRSYELNKDYDKEWLKRNPNHKGWVEPLYKDPTPCQTCEALARTVMMDQTSHDKNKEWVGLTDDEYELMAEKRVTNYFFNTLDYAHDIETKLKEKNT